GEHPPDAKTLADIAGHRHRQIGDVDLDPGRTAEATDRGAASRSVLGALPETTDPHHVLGAAGLLVVGDLGLDARDARERIGAAPEDARLEEADGNLRWRPALGAVGHLGVEVRIDVAVADAARRGTAALAAANRHRAHAEQGHVLHDVLAAEQPELAAGENLRPVLEPDRQVDLAHV